MMDKRVVYGAGCSWWDSIGKVASTPSGLPCCPRCGGVLFEVESEAKWWEQARAYERDGHPGYVGFLEWGRGRCLPSMVEARRVYDVEVAEGAVRAAEMAMRSRDDGRPGLSAHKNLDVGGARQLVGHLIESTAVHSKSRGWLPTISVTFDHVPLVGAGDVEHVQFLLELDAAQELIDALIDGLERAVGDSEYGLREP